MNPPSKSTLMRVSHYDPFEAAEADNDLQEAKRLTATLRALKPRTENTPVQVYVINAEGTNLCKIGVSVSAEKRLAVLQKGFPYKLWLVTVCDYGGSDIFRYERQLHKTMRDHRLNGEWFDMDPDMFLDNLQTVRERKLRRQQPEADGGNVGE